MVAIPFTGEDFAPGLEALEAAVAEGKVDCVLMCNPQNPNGAVWSQVRFPYPTILPTMC